MTEVRYRFNKKWCDLTETSSYQFTNGYVMRREFDNKSPNGNVFLGRWVLRNKNGEYIDHDTYRHDLIERHELSTINDNKE